MMPFMGYECLGNAVEMTYKLIYNGGGIEFSASISRLVHILGQLAEAGMITNMTRKKIEMLLTKDNSLSNVKVISRKTNDVVLVNSEIHEQDSFKLSEYITWITNELCNDPILKKSLCGRDSYEGVKAVLNSYENKKHKAIMKKGWIDFFICEDMVVFTKKDAQNIHLYIQEKQREVFPFSEDSDDCEEEQLLTDNLLDGKIYGFADGTIFVQSDQEYFLKIGAFEDARCCCSRIEGCIINQLENGSLIYISDNKLFHLEENGNKKMLVENALLGMTFTDGTEVFWKSRFRKKDLESGNIADYDELTIDKINNGIHSERISKEMLWRGLLLTLYNFDCMWFDNKIGNRIRFFRFFDYTPVPFTLNEISRKLSEIEEYCYDGDVIKTDGYTEAMGYLMSIEEQLDEKETYDALVYLLDNVKINPYEIIACNAGTELLDSFSFIFGDFDDIHNETSYDEEELSLDFLGGMNFNNINYDEMSKLLDYKIAELEKEIEEEERNMNTEKAEKRESEKSSKKGWCERKIPGSDETVIERSTDGVDTPSDD